MRNLLHSQIIHQFFTPA